MSHATLLRVTERIIARSKHLRTDYLSRMAHAREQGIARKRLSCGNLAHGFAAMAQDKDALKTQRSVNIGIVSAYNDMLSAHQPFLHYPELIKMAARNRGATAQFAGGVPAMCDGVTQGRIGMELSLFSRDSIAQASAIALSHEMFDAALMLGVCDKIVPGMLIGALSFGHLPVIFVPAGPMTSGLPNSEKARVRQAYASGLATREELLEAESASYHSAGTCTFYGTANTNQMLLEVMGLHMPGAAFINPGTPLRDALTVAATERATEITSLGENYTPMCQTLDEKAIVNAWVALAATGGSTNLAIHLIAIARAAGIVTDWTDLNELSQATPLLARVYPNGNADVNHFQAAGGSGFVIRELLDAGLLHQDIRCVHGGNLSQQAQEPRLIDLKLRFDAPLMQSKDLNVVRPVSDAFDSEGGLRLVKGRLGRAVVKVSAVKPEHRSIKAKARVFESQDALQDAFKAGELAPELIGDFVAVIRGQGPHANGMPELHKLTPTLSILQDRGQRVALLTDGRMSGASGKVLAAIHASPEAALGGPLAKVRTGDVIEICAQRGLLEIELSEHDWQARSADTIDLHANQFGVGRELFANMRRCVSSAEEGGCSLF
jgi:phosphogluconate dehydratase